MPIPIATLSTLADGEQGGRGVKLSKRPETAADQPFVWRLLLERTAQELPLTHLPQPVQDQILEMQVRSRLAAVRDKPGLATEVILDHAEPVGWMCLKESEDEVRLIEIVVSAQCRGRGVGTAAVVELIAAAGAAGKPLRLRVNVTNEGARRLYERLGFRRTSGDEVQHEMEIPARE